MFNYVGNAISSDYIYICIYLLLVCKTDTGHVVRCIDKVMRVKFYHETKIFLLKSTKCWQFLLNVLSFVQNVLKIVTLKKSVSVFCVIGYRLIYKVSFDNISARLCVISQYLWFVICYLILLCVMVSFCLESAE